MPKLLRLVYIYPQYCLSKPKSIITGIVRYDVQNLLLSIGEWTLFRSLQHRRSVIVSDRYALIGLLLTPAYLPLYPGLVPSH